MKKGKNTQKCLGAHQHLGVAPKVLSILSIRFSSSLHTRLTLKTMTEKDAKTLKKLILTSARCVKHPFAGHNRQHTTLNYLRLIIFPLKNLVVNLDLKIYQISSRFAKSPKYLRFSRLVQHIFNSLMVNKDRQNPIFFIRQLLVHEQTPYYYYCKD